MDSPDVFDILRGRIWPITTDRYHQMIDAGVFGPEDKLELIHGVLVARSPQGPLHAAVLQRLTGLLVRGVGEEYDVRPQLPLTASSNSEPEPDFTIVPHRRSGELPAHPRTAQLAIEVANTSLHFDRTVKAALYAHAGIPEYWVIDVNSRRVDVFREPDAKHGTYGYQRTLSFEDELKPELLRGPILKVREVLD